MTITAQLHDGTTLEFPDDTEDSVIDSVVKKHMSSAKQEESPDNTTLKQVGKNALGGLASAADFITGIGSLPLAGVAGVVGAAQDAYEGNGIAPSDFAYNASRRIQEIQDMFKIGKIAGIEGNEGYQAASGAMGVPGEMGTEAMRGIGAVTRLPFEGVEGAVRHITNPELTPFSSAAEDTMGTFLGYGLAGEAAKNAVTPRPNLRPTDVPPAVRDYKSEQQRPPPSPDMPPIDPKVVLELEALGADPAGKGSFMRSNRTGKDMPLPRDPISEPIPVDPTDASPYRGNNMDVDTRGMTNYPLVGEGRFMEGAELPPDAVRDAGTRVDKGLSIDEANRTSDLQRAQEEQNKAAADYEARRVEFGDDPPLRSTQELALDYDPFHLKDELSKVPEDWQVRDGIERGRESFPTIDIDLLPESVSKDSVIKGQLTKYNRIVEQINALTDKARDVAVAGERIKNQDVGRTKKSQEGVAQIKQEIDALQKKADVINKQLYNRLSSRHGVKEPGMKLFRGRDAEKTSTPDMQRSPDANITNSAPIERTFVPKGQRGSIDPSVFTEGLGKIFKGAVKATKTTAKTLTTIATNSPKKDDLSRPDLIRSLTGADSRDPATFAKEVLKDKDSLVDIADNDTIQGLVRKDLTPAAVGKLNYKQNPVTSYISHMMDKIDGATKRAKENAIWGKVPGVSLIRKLPDLVKSDSGARTITSTFKDKARQEIFRKTTMKYADGKILRDAGLESPTDSMLAGDGLNSREIQAYRAREKQFDQGLQELRNLGADVEKVPGFFPGIWMGDYRVFVKDAQGNTVNVQAFDHPYQAKAFMERAKKDLPDHTFEEVQADTNKYAMNDLSAFQIASKIFPADSTVGKILDNVRNDIQRHRGFMTHSKKKKGVGGSMGSEVGGFHEMEKAMDIYFEQMYNFIGDLQKRRAVEDTMQAFKEEGYSIAENLPNTNAYVHDILANSIGAMKNEMQLVDSVFEYAGQFSGRQLKVGGKSSAKHIIRGLNGFASLWNLFTGKQFMLNAMQPIYMLPKAMQLKLKLEDAPSITKAMLETYKEVFVPGMLSKESRSALEYARASGMIDARTLELIGSNTGKAKSVIMKATGHMASWWEQEAVRVPAFVFFNKQLMKEDMSPRQRHEAAAQMTADYMVNYSKTQTPAFYGRMGLAGEAARPYQQFTHNYHGQLLEYTNQVRSVKTLAPLATFMAAQWTLGGIRGMLPIVGGAMSAIAYLNNMIKEDGDGTPMPTPEEYLMGSGASDLAVFGLASKFTGVNVSTAGAAPNIIPTPGFPGLSFAAKMGKDVGGYLLKRAGGVDKEADRMKAAMTLSPSATDGAVEQIFARPNGEIPNPDRGMQSDLGRPRTTFENIVKMGLGAEPASEGLAKARLRASESYSKSISAKQQQYLDKFVDDLITKRGMNKEIIQKYVKSGGDPTKIRGAIESTLKKRLLSRVEAELLSGSNYDKAKHKQMMDKYQIKINGMTGDQMIEVLQNQ